MIPVVVEEREQPQDGWDDPVRGRLAWRTFFGEGASKTEALTVGVAEVAPGGWLGLHRHTPPEVYYVLEGRGVMTLDGVERRVEQGSAVFIPGDAEHGIRNDHDETLRFLYAFAVDSFDEFEYRFSSHAGDGNKKGEAEATS